MAIEATMAGIKGGMSGASAGASLGKAMKVGSVGKGVSKVGALPNSPTPNLNTSDMAFDDFMSTVR
jgi:hypothetical protein